MASKNHDSQLDKFKKAAREAGCDPSEKAFNESLSTLAKSKSRKVTKPTSKKD